MKSLQSLNLEKIWPFERKKNTKMLRLGTWLGCIGTHGNETWDSRHFRRNNEFECSYETFNRIRFQNRT